MAFALLVYKAHKLDKKQKDLENEKENAIKIDRGSKPNYSLGAKFAHLQVNITNAVNRFFTRIFSLPEGSWLRRTTVNMAHEGTFENYILKSIVGFIGGFFLTYLFFMFFAIILGYSIGAATLICSIIGCILTIGLAFSQRVRCVVFLILPQFFSKKGRQALIAYAFVLALTGPGKNTLNNLSILSESLACGQEQLKVAVRQIIDVIKKPFLAIRDAIKKIIKVVKVIVVKIKEIFLTIKRIVMGIVKVIKAVFQFLAKIFNICSKKVGTPFERCSRVFENAVVDCQAKLGPLFSWVCNIVYVVQTVCYIVKPLDLLCMILDFINTSIVGVIMKKIRTFIRQIRATFYVRVKFSHSFDFETTQSKTIREISADIMKEIKGRSAKMMSVFGFVSAATSCVIFIVVLRAIHYRYKFLTSERFDNRFVTDSFREIDLKRAQMEKETILPLNRRERKKYCNISSFRLVDVEKKQLSKSLAVLCSVTLKLGLHMVFDYSLYWLLAMIRFSGRYKNTIEAPRAPEMKVRGNGFIADLYKSIVKAFQPVGLRMDVDTVPCLPDPIPPNLERYIQIGAIIFLCWIFAIFEPYGLRLRHHFMCYYHPGRCRERSVWLYNHILRNRNGFLKFARRQLRRKFAGDKGITKITFMEFIRAKCDNAFCRFFILGSVKQEACLVCGEVFREEDETKPIRCPKPDCPGIYCRECFADLNNLCTICLQPLEYGDFSDIDEEVDSSEEETSSKSKRRSQQKLKKQNESSTNEEYIPEEEQSLLSPSDEETSERDKPHRARGGADFLNYFTDNSDSTDYSYTYQYQKNANEDFLHTRLPFVDLEEQRIPDYVSMDIFREDFASYEKNKNEKEQTRTVFLPKYYRKCLRNDGLNKELISSSDSENDGDYYSNRKSNLGRSTLRHRKPQMKRSLWSRKRNIFGEKDEKIPLLSSTQSVDNSSDSDYEFETRNNSNPINTQTSQHRENLTTLPLNSQGESSTISTEENTSPSCNLHSSRMNYLFSNVSFYEKSETQAGLSDSSYVASPSRNSFERDIRRRNIPCEKQEHLLRFLKDSQNQAVKYQLKVKEYYRKLKEHYK